MFHAEALFLVDYEEAEVFEMDILREEAVGSNDAIDATGGEVGETFAHFAGRDEATDLRDHDGIGCHAFAEGIEVLLAEDGGRYEDGGLFPCEDRFEHRPDCDLGFSETDIPANETIHGAGAFHVGFGRFDRGELVGGFLEGEGVLKFAEPEVVVGEGVTLRLITRGVEAEELCGVIEGGGLGGLTGFCPGLATDFAEFGGGFTEPDVARKEVGFREGDVEGHPVCKFYGEDFAGTVGGFELNVSAEEADPVLKVNEGVAVGEF
jgi:hypothetical protein